MTITDAEMRAMVAEVESLRNEIHELRHNGSAPVDDLACQLRMAHGTIRHWRDRHASVSMGLAVSALLNVGLLIWMVLR